LLADCALRALRKTPGIAACNHLATQSRASGWERMGLAGPKRDHFRARRVADTDTRILT